MIKMVKNFVCHDSENKFDPRETGDYVDKFINRTDTQYFIVYRLADTAEINTSMSNDCSSTTNDDASIKSF